jgi:hypothetical protein
MNEPGLFRYAFRDTDDPTIPGRVRISPWFFNERDHMIESLAGNCPPPPNWAHDLMVIARAVYLADKLSPRSRALDGWTRRFDLSVQLHVPADWSPLLEDLRDLLGTLTSDIWSITVVGGGRGCQETLDISKPRTSQVALFSGGLDSTAYAVTAVREAGSPLLLIAHYHNEKQVQKQVAADIAALRPPREFRLIQFRQLPRIRKDVRSRYQLGREMTTRSRGFLFTAAAAYAASAHGVAEVAVPENGQLAINPPLAPNRIVACNTRTAHPLSLHLLNKIIRNVGGDRHQAA